MVRPSVVSGSNVSGNIVIENVIGCITREETALPEIKECTEEAEDDEDLAFSRLNSGHGGAQRLGRRWWLHEKMEAGLGGRVRQGG